MAKLSLSIDSSTKTNTYDGMKMRFTLYITAVEKSGTEDLKVYYKVKSERLEGTSYPVATLSAYINGEKIKTWSNSTFKPSVGFPSKPGTSDEYSTTISGGWGNDFTYQVKGEIGSCKTMDGTKKECCTSMIKYYDYNGNLLGNSGWCYPTTSITLRSLSTIEGDYWLYDNKQYSPGASFKFPYENANYDIYDFRAGWDKLIFTQCYVNNITETSFSYPNLLVNSPDNVDKYYYKIDEINNGKWEEIASTANTIGGLSPSKAYTIHFKATFKNDPDGESKAAFADFPITTYAYPSISSYRLPTDYQNNGSFIFNNPLQRKIKIKVDVYNDSPRKPSGGTTPEIDDWLELIYEGTNTQNISNIFTAQDAEDMAFEHYDWFVKIPEWDSLFGDPYLKYTIFYTIDSNTWVSLLGESSDVYQNYNWSKSHPITVDNNKIANFITYIFSDYDSEARFSENNKDTTHLIPGKTTTMKAILNSNSNPFTSPTITDGTHIFRPYMASYKFYIDNVEKHNFSNLDSRGTINIDKIGVKDQYAIKIIAYNSSNASAEIETSISVSNGKVVLYKQPFVTLDKVERTSTGFNITTNGSWINITGISSSPAAFTLQYAEDTSGTPSWTSCDLSPTNLQLTKEEITVSGGLVFDKAYKFKLVLSDKYGTSCETSEYLLSGGTPILFIDSEMEGVGVNCFPTGTGLYAKNINIQNSGSINFGTSSNINFLDNADKIYMQGAGTGSNAIAGSSSSFSSTYINRLPAKSGTFAMVEDVPVLPTIEIGNLSITKTKKSDGTNWKVGNCTITYVRYGNILSYDISVPLNGKTASGENIVEGACSTTPSFKLAITTNSVGYIGKRAVVALWGTDDRITVRNASSTDIDNNESTVHCRGTVIVTDR